MFCSLHLTACAFVGNKVRVIAVIMRCVQRVLLFCNSKCCGIVFQVHGAIPVNIRTPPTDEQICPGVKNCLSSRGGTSLTLHVQGWNVSYLHVQGWKCLLPSMSRGGTSLTLHEIKLFVRGHHSFW